MFEVISQITGFYWLLASLLILIFSLLIQDFGLAFFTGISLAFVAAADYFGINIYGQLAVFSSTLLAQLYFIPRITSSNNKAIAETVEEVIGSALKIISIDKAIMSEGKAESLSGKIWTVVHENGSNLELGNTYICKKSIGIKLIIS